jgi:imidazolonepropionase-like amidohydrolase
VGKLADLIVVDGDPLKDIAAAHKVKHVIANGRVYEMNQLLQGSAAARSTSAAAR